jgi:tRNA A-37 threonylcarbamoyl transferase component Bud32
MSPEHHSAPDFPSEEKTVDQAPSTAQAPDAPHGVAVLPPLRYKPVEFHAKGALGEVLVAQDEELNRSVALKRIQVQYADDPASRRRFLREAEVTGRLEHPGVVPVYGLGQDNEGRPCYAMRFIQGEPLSDAIARFHAADKPGRDASERRLALRQLLTSFVTVCKTMAYAHSRRVVHRDLKPANIMLGQFGETLVVDWGLARPFARDDKTQPPAEEVVQPAATGSGGETEVGQMVGTPAYCSPEQAAGQWDVVGPASDIFSLGAVLYNVLTNRTPYRGPGIMEIIAQASTGEIIPPRQRNKQVPQPLEAICLKAMARQPEARYDTALELAADVEHWLADEPVQAYREPLLVAAGRWSRKHRPLVAGLAAAAAVALVSLTFVLVVVAGKNWELQLANQREAARAESERLAKDEAQRRLVQIEKGTDVLGAIFADLDPHAEEKEGKPLGEILGQRVERAAQQLEGESIADAVTVAKLQHILGRSLTALGLYPKAEALLEKSAATRAAQLGENDADTLQSKNELARAYHGAGQLDRALPLYQGSLQAAETALGDDHSLTLTFRNNLADAYRDDGKLELAVPLLERTVKAQELKEGSDHPLTLTYRSNLALAYQDTGKVGLAIPLLESIVQAHEVHFGDNHAETLESRNNLASAYQIGGKLDRAIALWERTLPAAEAKLGDNHPTTMTARNNLANAYRDAGQLNRALPLLERNFKITEAKMGDNHPHTFGSGNNLAYAYVAAGKLDLAIPLYEKLVPRLQNKLGPTHPWAIRGTENWITALEADHQYARAVTVSKELLQVQRKQLASDDPRLAAALAQLGRILIAAKQPLDAEAVLRESLTIRTKKDPDAWTTFNTQSLVGGALLGQKKYAEAEPVLVGGYQGMKERQAKMPPQSRGRLTEALERLVQLYEATGKSDEAAKWRKELDAAKAASKNQKQG